ncbi:MAG: YpdA family putative bacillithiol disulfide reductase [Candidatus Hydrogenedentes bacterium]|nr:YpdA family putative bacillithiol disulfide reductase [Candidatus Hydrogenedentota bacterium]
MKRYGLNRVLDIVIIGAGPAALSALHAAKQAGLDAVALDKGPICGALVSHPTYMRWFSTSDRLELAGFPLITMEKSPTRQEYLKYCRAFVKYFDLKIVTYHEVIAITAEDGLFRITVRDLFGREGVWQAHNAIFATGFYDAPRPLGVLGEDLPKVSHRYTEAHFYADQDVLVIGGGSSAAEVALDLWRNGARVTAVMRGDRFDTKYWIDPDIENRIAEGSITCYRGAEVVEIRMDEVVLVDATGKPVQIANDFVLAMTGYEPDTRLLESLGVRVDPETKKPALTENMETNVPGVYVAGTLCAGCETNTVFVENSRDHGPRIVAHILARRKSGG